MLPSLYKLLKGVTTKNLDPLEGPHLDCPPLYILSGNVTDNWIHLAAEMTSM